MGNLEVVRFYRIFYQRLFGSCSTWERKQITSWCINVYWPLVTLSCFEPGKISPVCVCMSVGLVIMLFLFRLYCWELLGPFSLLCLGDTIWQQVSWTSGFKNFLPPLQWLPLSLRYRGCIVDVSVGIQTFLIFCIWPVVDLCNSPCLMQKWNFFMRGSSYMFLFS